MANKPATISRYGARWPAYFNDLQIEIECIRAGGQWLDPYGRTLGLGMYAHYQNMQRILWPQLDVHRWSVLCLQEMVSHHVTVLMSPKSCVAGHTRIPNPVNGDKPTIEELYETRQQPMVQTLGGPRIASVPFIRGRAMLYEVVLKNGNRFTATSSHRVLTEHGYVAVASLRKGQCLVSCDESHPPSTWGIDLKLYPSGGGRWFRTPPSSPNGYPVDSHFYGEPLPMVLKTSPSGAPLPNDVHRRRYFQVSERRDGLDNTPIWPPFYQSPHRHAKDAILDHKDRHVETLYQHHFDAATSLDNGGRSELAARSRLKSCLVSPFGERGFYADHSYPVFEKPYFQPSVHFNVVQSVYCVGEDYYFDLQVPGFNHYLAEGVIHHNCGKTHEAAKFALCEYWIDPENTLVLMSTTDLRSLELRIWGEVKMLFADAKERNPNLAGHLLDAKHCIATDNIEEDAVRDLRKGIIGVPCVEGGKVLNLKRYQGIKQKRVIICADELAAMSSSFLSAFSNLDANPYFKAVMMGNPNTMYDPLGKAAEPKEGWDKYLSPEKTICWDTKFMNGRCVNLIGTDCPNFDFPQDKKPRYPYLITRRSIDSTAGYFTKDSMEYHSQCVGDMQVSQLARQVLTRQMCEQWHAMEPPVWGSESPHRIYGVDAAYGGDRCVGAYIEWGEDVSGKMVVCLHPPTIIPVSVKVSIIPEEQIAEFVMQDCLRLSIEPQHVYYDATGRGSLGTSFARLWSDKVNPVEFGGPPTDRPVSADIFVYDANLHQRRLMVCKERYDRFVTELWFAVRLIVECDQLRGMNEELLDEFTQRYWDRPKEKYLLETKKLMKERVGRSPDLSDAVVVAVEGARREGFTCRKLLSDNESTKDQDFWHDLRYKERQRVSAHNLNYAA